jgi:hypothetical protein
VATFSNPGIRTNPRMPLLAEVDGLLMTAHLGR